VLRVWVGFSPDLETDCSVAGMESFDCRVLWDVFHSTEQGCKSPGFFSLRIRATPKEHKKATCEDYLYHEW
jgi:hypothetical protein